MQRIAALYEVDARVRGKSPAERLAIRQAESCPLVTELRAWFEAQLGRLPARGPTAEAIRYALNLWDWLERFLEDGRIELDSNSVERAMRPVALSRKNSLFACSDEGGENWACLASLIETCKLNTVNLQTYITDALTRLVNSWPQDRIDELMPWHWAPTGSNRRPSAQWAAGHRLPFGAAILVLTDDRVAPPATPARQQAAE